MSDGYMTLTELKARGWTFKNHGTCSCGDEVEWWTSRYGNPLPFNPMNRGTDNAVPHKETCSERKS
jgi:hypothetical protein